MFLLELPHQGDSNKHTQYIIFIIKNRPRLFQICSYGIFSSGLKNGFYTAVVNELSVFEPLKFCILYEQKSNQSDLRQNFMILPIQDYLF